MLTDSCSDLSSELIKQYHIRQIPFVVTIGETSYLDGKEKISGACKKALQSMLVDFKSHLPI
ncbi:MAG: DegV family protein [Anaerolineaceae bacterium]